MSQALAYEAMKNLGFNNPGVVLSTIEAETNFRNVTGDSGRAVGYGQVWIKWHFAKLLKVADLLKIQLPSRRQPNGSAEEKPFIDLILKNNRLSMHLAVEVIKGFWSASGGDYVHFVKGYVGPEVPQAEINRRLVLYKKYSGQAAPVAAAVPVKVPSIGEGLSNPVVLVVTGLSVAAIVALLGSAGADVKAEGV